MQNVKQEFDRDGYVVLRGFLNTREIKELKDHVDRYMKDCVPKLSSDAFFYEVKGQPETLKQVPLKADLDPYFGKILSSGRMMELAEQLMGGGVTPTSFQWLNKPARVGKDTPPHQDGYYYMLEPAEAVAMWLALEDADEENGCMRYVPGSHRKPMREHSKTKTLGFSQGIVDYGEADRKSEVAVCAKPGDLLVHHCLTIHRADPNPSNRDRKALQLVYFSQRAKEDIKRKEAYQKSLKQELAEAGKI